MDKLTINLGDYVFIPVHRLGGDYSYHIAKVTDSVEKGVYGVHRLGYFSNKSGTYSFAGGDNKFLIVEKSKLIVPGKEGHEITAQLLKDYLEINSELLNYSINGNIV